MPVGVTPDAVLRAVVAQQAVINQVVDSLAQVKDNQEKLLAYLETRLEADETNAKQRHDEAQTLADKRFVESEGSASDRDVQALATVESRLEDIKSEIKKKTSEKAVAEVNVLALLTDRHIEALDHKITTAIKSQKEHSEILLQVVLELRKLWGCVNQIGAAACAPPPPPPPPPPDASENKPDESGEKELPAEVDDDGGEDCEGGDGEATHPWEEEEVPKDSPSNKKRKRMKSTRLH